MVSLIKTNIAESGKGVKESSWQILKKMYFQPNGNGSIAI